MIHPRFRHLGFACLLALFVVCPPANSADNPSAPPSAAAIDAEMEKAWRDGLQLELSRNWAQAVEHYQSAFNKWPQKAEFRQRLVLCEMHAKLLKRYQDQSFRKILLKLEQTDCVRLYTEVLDLISNRFVDIIDFQALTRRGVDNLEVALRDPEFQKANATTATQGQIQELRQWLRANRSGLALNSGREEARQFVAGIAEKAWSLSGLGPQAVYMEFVFGASDALDEFSSCLTPDKLEDLYAVIDGNFVGLGVELKDDPNGLLLTGVIRGGPAWDAGMKSGEVIIAVDGSPLRGLGLDQAAARLQGVEGTTVELVLADGKGSSRVLRLMRRPVEVESVVDTKIIDPSSAIGYLKLTSFQKTTRRELTTAIEKLNTQGMRLLILDLRGNPGGLLNCSVEIADQFLPNGLIVTTKGRSEGQSQKYYAETGDDWNFPVIVLVDRESASASEILAGALQENGRADVIGERSFGKGSVQSIFPIKSAPAGLKLTTARFYSPKDRPYTEGVTPNIMTRQVARPTNGGTIAGGYQQDYTLRTALDHARERIAGNRSATRSVGSAPTSSTAELR